MSTTWAGDDLADDLTGALRSVLHGDHATAGDEEVDRALSNILSSMSMAESINFAGALNQIARSAGQLAADPTVGAIARTALPIAGAAVGTYFGGPLGTTLGSKLGAAAAQALPTATRPATPAAPTPAAVPTTVAPTAVAPTAVAPTAPIPTPPTAPAPTVAPMAAPTTGPATTVPATAVPGPGPQGERGVVAPLATQLAAPVVPSGPIGQAARPPGAPGSAAAGSSAAAQATVLTQHPQMLQALLAAALGQQGRREVGGVPVARMLGMLGQLLGQAAADADELAYLDGGDPGRTGDGESTGHAWTGRWASESDEALYLALVDADNFELAERGFLS